ncbi:methylenetetrahydrofolate reductase [Candidatus Altiarchaeota archaeon]
MGFREKVEEGEFVITSEIAPRKGHDAGSILETAGFLSDHVDAINVTDNQRACVRASSLAASKVLLDKGIEPIYQATTRDRNRIGIQSDLLGAMMLGIRNILALTGDHPAGGDHPQAKPVYDIDSTQLLKLITMMNEGTDMEGNPLDSPTDFFPGAAFNPGAEDRDVELLRISRKMDAGALFFQTQVVYDADDYLDFMKEAPKGIRVLPGIVPLKSRRMAEFMNEKVPGVNVPKDLIAELDEGSDPLMTGLDQAARIIRAIKPHASGVHVMALGAQQHVAILLEKAGLR